MKTIKPLKLGLITRPFEAEGRCHLVISAMAYFPFQEPERLSSEVALWKDAAPELGFETVLDEGMPKLRGEVLVLGRAYPPGGGAQPACSVRLQVGSGEPDVEAANEKLLVDKTLYVVGDRFWKSGVWTEPVPFREMPLDWSHAFGGEGVAENPVGRGADKVKDDDGHEVHPLPNVEHPKKMVKSPSDRPPPVGFRGYRLDWPQRSKHMGTYGERWLRERAPGFAEDFDWAFFNVAPPDQQLDGFFDGELWFRCENMHPSERRLEGRIPQLKARCFVTRSEDGGEELVEVTTRLDTVVLLPHRAHGIAIYRGVVPVAEDDASDLLQLVAAFERPGEPKSLDHYREVLRQRLDKEMGGLYALRDGDLMPAGSSDGAGLTDEIDAMARILEIEGLQQTRLRAKAQRSLEDARADIRAQLLAADLDPDDYPIPDVSPAEPEAVKMDDIPALVERARDEAAAAQAEAESKRAEAEARARAECEEQGIDYDALVATAEADIGGPPRFTAEGELQKLRDMLELARNAGVPLPAVEERLAQPDLREQLESVEVELRRLYRDHAHHQAPARKLDEEAAHLLKQQLALAFEAGDDFGGRDLTGADLSKLSLPGARLEGALLEHANLSGCDLSGANLAGAVLARADLSGANLQGAKLRGCNLGKAKLVATDLRGADLSDAQLYEADLSEARLQGAKVEGADFTLATFSGADLTAMVAPKSIFLRSDMRGAKLCQSDLSGCLFVELSVADADFSGSILNEAAFVSVCGDGARFASVQADSLRVVHESSFRGTDFRGASMKTCNFRGTDLEGSDLSGSKLDTSDFSECNLRDAKLDHARARGSMWIRTDLRGASLLGFDAIGAIMQKAKIRDADFRGANLFRVDFAKIDGDVATNFDDANMKQIRFVDRRRDG